MQGIVQEVKVWSQMTIGACTKYKEKTKYIGNLHDKDVIASNNKILGGI